MVLITSLSIQKHNGFNVSRKIKLITFSYISPKLTIGHDMLLTTQLKGGFITQSGSSGKNGSGEE
jgi:hypothetical protein